MEQEANPELEKLKSQLAETITAERFFETDTGRLWQQLATREIDRLLKEITSDKFDRDHQGYVNAKIELKCYRNMLRKMQVAASPIRREKLKELLDGTE